MTDAQHQQQPTAAPAVITVPPPAQTADKSSPSSKTKRVPAPPKRAAGTKVVSRSKRAGLSMPVGRIARLMKDMHPAERLSGTAPVAMAAGLEAIAATVLAKAGEKVVEKKKCRIKPKYISMAAAVDRDLHDLLKDSILSTVEIAPENKVAKETIDTAAKKSRDAAKREKKKKAKMATAQSQDEKMKEIKRLAANAKVRFVFKIFF